MALPAVPERPAPSLAEEDSRGASKGSPLGLWDRFSSAATGPRPAGEPERPLDRHRLEAVIHSLEDALFILDREGEVTLANAAAEALLPRLRQARGPGCSQCGNQLRRAGCHQRSGSYLECLADFDRSLEPFFTTKAPDGGTGLGLPTARRTAEAQGGRLELVEGDGPTTFELTLPLAAAAAASVPGSCGP